MKEFLSYLKPYKRDAVLAVFCIEAETVFELIIPLVMASIVDVGVATGDRHYILMKGLQMVLFALISLVLGQGSAMFSARCGQGLGAEIRKAEFAKLQQFSFANTDHFSSSSLVTRLTSDVTTIQNSVATGMRPAFRSPVMMLTAMAASFYINPQLALVFLVAAPVLGVLLFFIISHVRPLYSVMQGAIDMVNRIIQENLTAIRVVKSYVRGDYEIQKFEEVNYNLQFTAEKAFRLAVLNMPAMQLVMYSTILCILWFGGRLVTIGGVKVGELTGFLSYVMQVLNSLMMFSNVFLMTTRALASWKRISEVMDEEIDIKEDMALDLNVEQGDIRFEHVYFKYNKEAAEYVLSDISFHIKPGQTVGIIGGTGSGKSTLVNLIPRFYDATEGGGSVDGHDVREYPLDQLRGKTGIVPQKAVLFHGTLRENMQWGKKNATDDEIYEALKTAQALEFVEEKDEGLELYIQAGGKNLSGGQRQRLTIARALVRKPEILIMDDSASALDFATDAALRHAIHEQTKGMTVFIVSQRATSIKQADKILVLDDGELAGVGTHKELMESCEVYREICLSQLSEQEVNR